MALEINGRRAQQAADVDGVLGEARREGELQRGPRRAGVGVDLPTAIEPTAAGQVDRVGRPDVGQLDRPEQVEQVGRRVRADLQQDVPRLAEQPLVERPVPELGQGLGPGDRQAVGPAQPAGGQVGPEPLIRLAEQEVMPDAESHPPCPGRRDQRRALDGRDAHRLLDQGVEAGLDNLQRRVVVVLRRQQDVYRVQPADVEHCLQRVVDPADAVPPGKGPRAAEVPVADGHQGRAGHRAQGPTVPVGDVAGAEQADAAHRRAPPLRGRAAPERGPPSVSVSIAGRSGGIASFVTGVPRTCRAGDHRRLVRRRDQHSWSISMYGPGRGANVAPARGPPACWAAYRTIPAACGNFPSMQKKA